MASTLNWQPAPPLIEKILRLAQQRGQSPETILTEAVLQYLEIQPALSNPQLNPTSSDSLIGLFSSSPNLSTRAEEILEQEIMALHNRSMKSGGILCSVQNVARLISVETESRR